MYMQVQIENMVTLKVFFIKVCLLRTHLYQVVGIQGLVMSYGSFLPHTPFYYGIHWILDKSLE